ncbi:hypothetical protein Q3G72_002764 [Acer saccharum]|nr:hypothetical protein Q3G72_002764 [Acer saccharum]
MYGNHRPRYPSGGGGGAPPPPPPPPLHQPQPPQLNPNFSFQNPNIYFSNPDPALQLLYNLTNIPSQNPNLLLQNPNFLLQNSNLLHHQQFHPNPYTLQPQIQTQTQSVLFPRNHTSHQPQNQIPTQTQTQSSPQPQKLKKEVLEKIDNAVLKARNRIIAAGEGVTAWKICQWAGAALMFEVDSWSSLGFPMQEVPSFRKLMVIEAKINAFIHCFVEVRKITTLYDLEEAICKNESIGTFEELELGPFLRHQLVMHYFSVNSDVTEVVKITNNDIIISLCEYLDTHKKKHIKIDKFLDFIANKRSLAIKEKLGVRIQNLGMHVKFIREARKSEDYFKKKKGKRRSEDDGQDVKLDEPGILLSDKSTRMFIATWKEACKDHTADEVLGRMIQFYRSTYPKKTTQILDRLKSMFSYYPFLGLLNIAVASIKCGMWDSVYGTLQAIGQRELTTTYSDKCSEYENIEVEPSKMAPAVNTEHIVHHTHNNGVEASSDRIGNCCTQLLSEVGSCKDGALIIESIRREEFGLVSSLSNVESSLLKKQHARLGRALHCLSQELYSQDSHFLLELVQNADDNMYPENAEPTLTFILQESGITVLNNELGFSARNIRALCDVGNSTKQGSGAGYIGQKGIGFKSVFRVTDAPEIHSNGFHVKFDISEGQIGFVLPTVVSPCNIAMLSRMASKDPILLDNSCWNTCIRLPFRSKLSEGIIISNIVAMFSDLHPSLLLFLRRLQCIVFRNMLNDSLIVMRKEMVGNGIIKVSCGEEKMTWFVASKKLQAETTEIAIAFTLQETNGNYCPLLDQQPVFAFLPLRTYGLKFILQGDFVLPSSREEVDGNSPWNQWLLSEFPGLFVSAEKSFCDLPCFREDPAKAVAAFMSFVPLVGEVHGFFSSLPRMIISKLRMSNCLLLEGDNNHWVPPCKVLRGWNDEARNLLPNSLLHDHLGLGFLNKDIVLSDPLARAMGIEEYGPKFLLQIIASLCRTTNGLKSMGLSWLSSWLNALYTISFHSPGQSLLHSGIETDIISKLQKIPFVPLSDGTFSSVDEGTIWLHSDGSGVDGGLEAFPHLYGKLRTVSPSLLSASAVDISCLDGTSVDHLTRMLLKIGVQQLSAHDIVKEHILPSISDDTNVNKGKNLMIDYLCFVMIHLQSSCPNCQVEREFIVSELRNKAFILTNHGYKRSIEVSIHFGKDFGNPVDVNKLINSLDIKWHEVDISYLEHPATESLSYGLIKWRSFFQEIGVTDFVQVVQVDKSMADVSLTISRDIWDTGLISPRSTAKDWESIELVHLLSLLSTSVDRESCKYLLEILDTLWDDCYSAKTIGYCHLKPSGDGTPFKSSFICNMHDIQWAVSSMDTELHYPKDLFHYCDAVCSILGASAPYIIPKVKSEKLLRDIGLKTEVTTSDILDIVKVWIRSGIPFNASIAQMSRFYTFIWNEMVASKHEIGEELLSGPFVFVPYISCFRHEDVVSGVFLSSEEVYWHDSTGTIDLMKEMQPRCSSIGVTQLPLAKNLCNVYPGLHEFFVKNCGVHDSPSFRSYLEILLELSTVALPSQAANAVFQVFLRWAEAMKSGLLNSEDVVHMKDCLVKLEYTVLPTTQDEWVSLHPSFGLVCWCDDKKLKKRFKHLDNIDFIYFGELGDHEQELLQTKVSTLMQTVGIPALSEVVTHEAIYYGLGDGSFKYSLVNWALPYAQRYIFSVHPDKYHKFKQSGFDTLNRLQIVVVEKLFRRNVIKNNGSASKKRFKCSCLLQGNVLYTIWDSDSRALYMELSCLFFDGNPELHFANFLHMITTMVESGSTEEQMEFFILNSQKVLKLPVEESVWSLPPSSMENDESIQTSLTLSEANEQNSSKSKRKPRISSNWPPVGWKTAPDFSYARANGFKTQAAIAHPSRMLNSDDDEDFDTKTSATDATLPIGNEVAMTLAALILPDAENMDDQLGQAFNQNGSSMNIVLDPTDKGPKVSASKFSIKDRLNTGAPNVAQASQTGKDGELAAFKHFTRLFGKRVVKWVNEINETGLPYDIVIWEKESEREYIEVKATKSARKVRFNITVRQWQFAVEKGETFSVAHVILSDSDAKVTVYKNPVKLCQQGKLQLCQQGKQLVMMAR